MVRRYILAFVSKEDYGFALRQLQYLSAVPHFHMDMVIEMVAVGFKNFASGRVGLRRLPSNIGVMNWNHGCCEVKKI